MGEVLYIADGENDIYEEVDMVISLAGYKRDIGESNWFSTEDALLFTDDNEDGGSMNELLGDGFKLTSDNLLPSSYPQDAFNKNDSRGKALNVIGTHEAHHTTAKNIWAFGSEEGKNGARKPDRKTFKEYDDNNIRNDKVQSAIYRDSPAIKKQVNYL